MTKDGRSHEEYYSKLIKADPSGKDQVFLNLEVSCCHRAESIPIYSIVSNDPVYVLFGVSTART